MILNITLSRIELQMKPPGFFAQNAVNELKNSPEQTGKE